MCCVGVLRRRLPIITTNPIIARSLSVEPDSYSFQSSDRQHAGPRLSTEYITRDAYGYKQIPRSPEVTPPGPHSDIIRVFTSTRVEGTATAVVVSYSIFRRAESDLGFVLLTAIRVAPTRTRTNHARYKHRVVRAAKTPRRRDVRGDLQTKVTRRYYNNHNNVVRHDRRCK